MSGKDSSRKQKNNTMLFRTISIIHEIFLLCVVLCLQNSCSVQCKGNDCPHMGYWAEMRPGKYYLETLSSSPFCNSFLWTASRKFPVYLWFYVLHILVFGDSVNANLFQSQTEWYIKLWVRFWSHNWLSPFIYDN